LRESRVEQITFDETTTKDHFAGLSAVVDDDDDDDDECNNTNNFRSLARSYLLTKFLKTSQLN